MGAFTTVLRVLSKSLRFCLFLLLLGVRPLVVPLLRLAGRLLLFGSPLVFGFLYLAARSATRADEVASPYWVGGGLFALALAVLVVADGYDSVVLALCPEGRVIVLH